MKDPVTVEETTLLYIHSLQKLFQPLLDLKRLVIMLPFSNLCVLSTKVERGLCSVVIIVKPAEWRSHHPSSRV